MAEKFIYILENLLAAIILMLLDQVSRQEISVSIVRIAQTAGVSTATVSRVLNDMPGVRDETKSQVRLAVEALNYRLPANKRGPKPGGGRKPRTTRRTGVIAVIAVGSGGVGGGKEWLGLPVMAAAVSGITRAASQSGLKVMLEEMSEIEKPSLSVINKEVDGAIAFLSSSIRPGGFAAALTAIQRYVPVVWAMGGDAGITVVDHVLPDDRAIARLAFDYLVQAGCKKLAFVTSAPAWAMMRNRGQAFSSLAHDARMSWSVYLVSKDVRDGDLFGRHAVVEPNLDALVDRIAAASPRPDGIFMGNDATAAFVHPMLLARGIRPDSDIRLVSCDNEKVRLDGLFPRPLSIDIGASKVGASAVRRLRFRIENPNEPPLLIKVSPSVPLEWKDRMGR